LEPKAALKNSRSKRRRPSILFGQRFKIVEELGTGTLGNVYCN
jgi:hypothetical protein